MEKEVKKETKRGIENSDTREPGDFGKEESSNLENREMNEAISRDAEGESDALTRQQSISLLRRSFKGDSFKPQRSFSESKNGYRINRYLATAGYGSRRTVEEYVLSGRVKVNGSVVQKLDVRVLPGDMVLFDDKLVVLPEKPLYYAMNKPPGYVVSRKDFKHAPSIYKLLPENLQVLNYAGRLDQYSRGLLILSNDGDFIQMVTHPSRRLMKRYIVRTDRLLPESEMRQIFSRGVEDDGELLRVLSLAVLDRKKNVVEICLVEGRNRHIRRMFSAIKIRVLDLCRISIGHMNLNNLALPEGKFVPIQPDEIFFGHSDKISDFGSNVAGAKIKQ